jgi:hypothetical protein
MKKHFLIEGLYRVFRWTNSLSHTPKEYRPPKGWRAVPAEFDRHPVTNLPLPSKEIWIVEIKKREANEQQQPSFRF